MRNKRTEGLSQFSSEKAVIVVHGATYPAETAFELQLAGKSSTDHIAERGYDAYLLNVRECACLWHSTPSGTSAWRSSTTTPPNVSRICSSRFLRQVACSAALKKFRQHALRHSCRWP
jgi:hypothetical protein